MATDKVNYQELAKSCALTIVVTSILFVLLNVTLVAFLQRGTLDILAHNDGTLDGKRVFNFVSKGVFSWLKYCVMAGALTGLLSWLLMKLWSRQSARAWAGFCLLTTFPLILRGVVTYPAIVEGSIRGIALGSLFDVVLDWVSPAMAEGLLLGIVVVNFLKAASLRSLRKTLFFVSTMCLIGYLFSSYSARIKQPSAKGTILIAIESLRTDHLHCCGYEREITPNLDKLASQGVLFPEVIVPQARTRVAITSLMTGSYPHTHGIRHIFPNRRKNHLDCATLPQLLRENGITTAAIGDFSTDCLQPFDMGFSEEDISPEMTIQAVFERELFLRSFFCTALLLGSGATVDIPAFKMMHLCSDPRSLAEKAIDKIQDLAGRDKPYFLFIFFSGTHVPFAAPTPYWKLFPSERGSPFRYAFGPVRFPDVTKLSDRSYSEQEKHRLIELYDSALYAVDDGIGRITNFLSENELDSNTSVFVIGDHGTDLFDGDTTMLHGDWFKGGLQSNRVPLIGRVPKRTVRGSKSTSTLSSIDLAPTILELNNIHDFPTMDGSSFAKFLGEPSKFESRTVFAETGMWISSKDLFKKDEVLHYPDALSLLLLDEGGVPYLDPVWEDEIVRSKLRMVISEGKSLIYRPTEDGFSIDLPQNFTQNLSENDRKKLKSKLFDWMALDSDRSFDQKAHLVRH